VDECYEGAVDPVILAILGGIGVLLLAFKLWMDHSNKKERAKMPIAADEGYPPKEECKALVLTALSDGENLAASNEALIVDEDCREMWEGLPAELTSFIAQHGKVTWETTGFIGGRISHLSHNRAVTKFLKSRGYGTTGVIIGADEGEVFVAMPGVKGILAVMPSYERVDVYKNIFELLVGAAGLETESA
jgi:hypothetical protein